jgi:hypothetical protein
MQFTGAAAPGLRAIRDLFRLRRRVSIAIALILPAFVACSSDRPTQAEDPDSVEGQIRALFPVGSLQNTAPAQIAEVRAQIASNAMVQARAKTLSLVTSNSH